MITKRTLNKSHEMPNEFCTAIGAIQNVERRLTLRVPGSSANIGPGFDAFGLALKLFTWVDVAVLAAGMESQAGIYLCGETVKDLPKDSSNIIWQILEKELSLKGKQGLLSRLRVTEYSEVPLERGLGSSGAAIIAAVYAARHLSAGDRTANSLLLAASDYEPHIDNMSASLLGNFVIAYKKEQEIIARSLRWPADWDVFAVVPSYSVKTSHSRSILPDRYTKQDVIENIQRVSLITAAIIQADATLLRQSMGDRLHEPFRIAIVPELKSLREALKDEPIMGCVLSGAGSSMLVIVEHSCKHQIQDALSSWAKKQSCAISVIETSIDTDGLTIMSEQI